MRKIDKADVARDLGMKNAEILAVEDSEAGLIVDVFDGTRLVIVPEDNPDADGKTGVMYLVAPVSATGQPYTGDAPIFAQPGADVVDDADAIADDEYPEKGSEADVLAWVAGQQDRAEFALEYEAEHKKRKGLTAELDGILAQYDLAAGLERLGVEVPDGGHGEIDEDGHARAFNADGELVASTDPDDADDGVTIVSPDAGQ